MAPFGSANPKPVFDAASVEMVGEPRRIKDRHLKLKVRQDGRIFSAMAWRCAERAEFIGANRHALRLAYSLDRQTWQGQTTIELTVADVRAPEQPAPPADGET
jgi:single-stranded-DNA-specific exonuclease